MSKIRVAFKRPFTYAEIETFRSSMTDVVQSVTDLKWHFTEDKQKVYIETKQFNSRDVYEEVAGWCEHEVVNQHPTAVRTFSDEVVEDVVPYYGGYPTLWDYLVSVQ